MNGNMLLLNIIDDVLQRLNAPINSIKFKNKHNFIRELKLANIDTPRAN